MNCSRNKRYLQRSLQLLTTYYCMPYKKKTCLFLCTNTKNSKTITPFKSKSFYYNFKHLYIRVNFWKANVLWKFDSAENMVNYAAGQFYRLIQSILPNNRFQHARFMYPVLQYPHPFPISPNFFIFYLYVLYLISLVYSGF